VADFNNLIITGTIALAANTSVSNNLTVSSSGDFDLAGFDLTVGGNWDIVGSGVFAPNGGKVTFDGATGSHTIRSNGQDVDDLEIDSGTSDYTLLDNFRADSLTLTNGTLDADSFTVVVDINFTNSATFTPGTSTFQFVGGSTSIATGSTTFNNLTITTPAKQVNFKDGDTFTVSGALTLGSVVSDVILRSTSDGVQWIIDRAGSFAVQGVDVKDSRNIGGGIIALDSVDSGNTILWFFASSVIPDDVERRRYMSSTGRREIRSV